MPKECAETWEKWKVLLKTWVFQMSNLNNKKQFENEVKQMKSEEAVKICRMQGTALGFIGQ